MNPRSLVVAGLGLLLAAPGAAAAIAPPAAAPAAAPLTPSPPPRTIVVCAPGYPGNTEAARPTMDAFARAAAAASGWPEGSLRAVYYEKAAGGLQRLAGADAVLALVSLPFFLQHETGLGLAPLLQVAQAGGALETWSLACRAKIASVEALKGYEITGIPGYAPEFVRGVVLAGSGALPDSARITFTPNVLSALRRAAAGEPVAVVLDGAQTAAMAALPFHADLEIVARSQALPGTVLCEIGRRLAPPQAGEIAGGLRRLHTRPDGEAALKAMRMTRFDPVDPALLDAARRAFAAGRAVAATPRP